MENKKLIEKIEDYKKVMWLVLIIGIIMIAYGSYNFFYGDFWERYNLNSLTGVLIIIGIILSSGAILIMSILYDLSIEKFICEKCGNAVLDIKEARECHEKECDGEQSYYKIFKNCV